MNPQCEFCRKVMTPESSRIMPEMFVCDDCARKDNRSEVQAVVASFDSRRRRGHPIFPPIEEPLTGVGLIAKERAEQTSKHGYSVEHDQDDRACSPEYPPLLLGASHCIDTDDAKWPWKDTLSPTQKGYCRIHQLKVAGALIAAEIDRLLASGETKVEGPA